MPPKTRLSTIKELNIRIVCLEKHVENVVKNGNYIDNHRQILLQQLAMHAIEAKVGPIWKYNYDIIPNSYESTICCDDTGCAICIDEISERGFPKTRIVVAVKNMLNKVENIYGRNNKIAEVRKIFSYLNTEQCKAFMQNNNNFQLAVKNKLYSFYNEDNLREAKVWYRNIFGHRMPIK